MLNKVVGLVADGKLTEARKIVREELDNRKAALLEEGKAFVAGSIKADDKEAKKKDPAKKSHDGGAD